MHPAMHGDSIARMPPELLESLAALMADEDPETRELATLLGCILVVRKVDDYLFEPQKGVIHQFTDSLEELAESIDRHL